MMTIDLVDQLIWNFKDKKSNQWFREVSVGMYKYLRYERVDGGMEFNLSECTYSPRKSVISNV